MRNHKREAQGIRKRQKTYSKYFMWQTMGIGTIFILVVIASLWLHGEYRDGIRVHTEVKQDISSLQARIDRLEAK